MYCKKKKWIQDLCPLTCRTCNVTQMIVGEILTKEQDEESVQGVGEEVETEEDEESKVIEEEHVGIIENDMFVTANQPLQAKLNLFGQRAIEPYTSCEDFRSDLSNAAAMIVNEAITSNARLYDTAMIEYLARNGGPPVMAAEMNADDSQGEALPSPDQEGEDSFETNVQVEGIDEADVIKSTNTTVYAAYGDKLLVWDARTLKMLSETVMPFREEEDQEKNRKLDSFYIPPYNQRRGTIKGLLLYKDRLAVIVSYSRWYYYPFWDFGSTMEDRPIINNNTITTLRLYNVSNLPQDGGTELQLISKKRIVGYFKEGRLMNNTAHIVTTSSVDTFYHLTNDLSPYSNPTLYANMTKAAYIEAATELAKTSLIPLFVEKFVNETSCENLHQITLFQSFTGNESQKIYKAPMFSIISGYLEVNTFDMGWNGGKELQSKSISLLLPYTYHTVVYAAKDKLVLATRGHEIASNGTSWTEASFIQVLSLGTSTEVKNYYGEVTGHPLNQYAIDLWDGHLRLATTQPAVWACVEEFPESSQDEDEDEDDTEPEFSFRRPCISRVIVDSDNFIHVLEFPTDEGNHEMDQVGYLNNLGKVGERIYSVRFMKDKAFVVTFLQTDPFYAIDLANHTEPKEVSALEIPGFSNYLHPFDKDGHLIIGVGQDADKEGRITGLQISLFNATNLTDAKLIQQYNIEEESGFNSTDMYSSSTAQYDPKAFRFLPKSKKLIIPASIRNYKDFRRSFDGFLVFDLSLEKIAYSFNISHVNPNEMRSFCWYNAYLPSRSLVHKGVVTTIKGHTVLAHDLESQSETMKLNLDANNTDCFHGGYWLF